MAYKHLIGTHFSGCDFGMLIKIFNAAGDTTRYSPGSIIEFKMKAVHDTPDEARMYTSHVERGNLTIRMGMRKFTRLTNGFSKKFESHQTALGLHFALYNIVTKHGTLKTTPATAVGVAKKPWTVDGRRTISPPPTQRTMFDWIPNSEE